MNTITTEDGTQIARARNVDDDHRDVASASPIEVWIDKTATRTWFLFEATLRRN